MLGVGFRPPGILSLREMVSGAFGVPTWDFDPANVTFDPGMAKRATNVFAASPIVQGKFDFSGTGDVLSFSRGSQIDGHFYENFDGYQWYCGGWWTPEQASGSGKVYLLYASSNHYFAYDYDNSRFELKVGSQTMTDAHALTAGTRLAFWAGGSSIQDLDGTNYARISINDVHTYGCSTQPTASSPDATIYVGGNNGSGVVNGIIEGLVIVRRVPFDGTYGEDFGDGDIINAHYNAGTGADVALSIGSWDTTFSLPTDATVEELTTGTGEAWSHPHSSAVLTDTYCETTYAGSAWGTEGTPSAGPADITAAERIFQWGYEFTVDAANEGITQTLAGLSAGANYVIRTIAHEDDSNVIRLRIRDETNGATIVDFDFGSGSDKDTPGVALITFELPTIARNGVAADCVSISVKVMGTNAGQTVYVHQVELQSNLIDNPSLETGAGNPWIPDGWQNQNAELGDLAQELIDYHSGASCLEYSTDADAEGIKVNTLLSANYASAGFWSKVALGALTNLTLADGWGLQTSGGTGGGVTASGAAWNLEKYIWNTQADALIVNQFRGVGATAAFLDDIYLFALDDVSLTVTPASEANSAENSGIRCDGYDELTATPFGLSVGGWIINFKIRLRDIPANLTAFNNPETLFHWDVDANNYIRIYSDTANQLDMDFNADGGGLQNGNGDVTGLWTADEELECQLQASATSLIFRINGADIITINQPAIFANEPDEAIYFGLHSDGDEQFDAVFL